MIGGTPGVVGAGSTLVGLSPLDAGNSNPNDVGFVFSATVGTVTNSLQSLAYVISHETGHTVGLAHITPSNDIMNPTLSFGTLIWGAGPLSVTPSETQDDNALLLTNLGSRSAGTVPAYPPVSGAPGSGAPGSGVSGSGVSGSGAHQPFPLGGGALGVSIFRPTTGQWAMAGTPSLIAFGAPSSDIPVPADYYGQGHAQVAVYRPATSQWFITGSASGIPFGGANGDVPLPADYDGVGHSQIAVYRPSTAQWYIAGHASGAAFGGPGTDVPVPADYDGVGHAQIAVFRPSAGQWYIAGHPSGISFGGSGVDIPVPGDYDGVGHAQIAVFRPSTAEWFVAGHAHSSQFGAAGLDVPLNMPLLAWEAIRRLVASGNPFSNILIPPMP
jgi:hypothetical protein